MGDKSKGLIHSYARQAHTDFSDVIWDNGYKMLTKRGVPEAEAKHLDKMIVNAWQPFGTEPVRDNPLAILDWSSVNPETDVHGPKRGAAFKKGNIYGTQVTWNAKHRWLYMPEQKPEEVWFFKQVDSRSGTERDRPG